MATTLGVLGNGPSTMGLPFNILFDSVQSITDVNQVKDVQAVVLWGGEDISPSLYGQKPNNFCEAPEIPTKRDSFEWNILKTCVASGVPIIGVCRGAQLMCAFDGGTIAQDIAGHGGSHLICDKDNLVFLAAGSHHQMMLPRPTNKLLAWAHKEPNAFYIGENNTMVTLPPGFKEPEAVWFPDIRGLGFQFHPEWEPRGSAAIEWALNRVKEYLL